MGLTEAGVAVALLGVVSVMLPADALLPVDWPSSGVRMTPEIPISETCMAKAKAGRCDFYRCFDQRFPCHQHNYALAYGWNFCIKFDHFYGHLDGTGKQWLNATRKCSMTAMLEIYKSPIILCGDVEREMLDRHAKCGAENGLCNPTMMARNSRVFANVYGIDMKTARRFVVSLKNCGYHLGKQVVEALHQRFKEQIPDIKDFFKNIAKKVDEGIDKAMGPLTFIELIFHAMKGK